MKQVVTQYLADGLAGALPRALAVSVLVLAVPGEQKGAALSYGAIVIALEILFEAFILVAAAVIKRNKGGSKNG